MWLGEITPRIPQSSWGIQVPGEKKAIDQLEGIQRQAMRMIKVLEDMTYVARFTHRLCIQ